MVYVLLTELSKSGNLVFKKTREGKGFIYYAQSEFGSIQKVTKEDIIENANSILNVRVADNNIYPVKIKQKKGFTKDEIQQAIAYVTETNKRGEFQHWLSELCEELRDNEEVVLAAMKTKPINFDYASSRLKRDKNIAYEAVKLNSSNLGSVHIDLKRDKEFVLKCVGLPNFDIFCLRYLPISTLCEDEEFCRDIIMKLCGSKHNIERIMGSFIPKFYLK